MSNELVPVNQSIAIRKAQDYHADYVPHIDFEKVRAMRRAARIGRNALIIGLLFDGCLRASELIGVRPVDLEHDITGWQIRVLGKGHKRSVVAISATIAAELQSYIYTKQISPRSKVFPVNRHRVYQIVQEAMNKAGVVKPAGVGAVHVLRHSGAIERLRRTGNPKAVQDQLRHESAAMTMRYLKTLTHEESIKIQQGVDLEW